MIKIIALVSALSLGLLTASVVSANQEGDILISICGTEAEMAQQAAQLRYKYEDITHPQIIKVMNDMPLFQPFIISAFKQRYVSDSYFNNDREESILRYKSVWFSVCLKDMKSKYKLK